MGRPNSGSGDDRKRFLKHPSHNHHLELATASSAVVPSDRATCFGCYAVVLPGTPFLSCRACAFYLHRECCDFPKRIRHPADDHVLVLDTSGAASFLCKACGSSGNGFAYRCTTCCQDFHCVCTAKALSVTDTSVHKHELKLCFKPPYGGENGFRCDLCGQASYSWLYCCQACHFDVHVDYAKCKAGGESGPPYQTRMRNIQDSVPRNIPLATDQYPNGTSVTTTRALINNMGQPRPQLMANGSFVHVTGQGVAAPIPGPRPGSGNFVYLRPLLGNSQPVHLQPNGGPPMYTLQPNTGLVYGMPMMPNGRPRPEMKDMPVEGAGTGVVGLMGKPFLGMGMGGSGLGGGGGLMGSDLGGGSLMGLDLGDNASDLVGRYAGEWASGLV
ncbi:hypothetical protein MLD38_004229 [Melastoma candidum]|uniref:Uncharacterized protein n=1 Tax=Melastoma candidum TaxID=119954 RepID=A0ACB9S8W4_9MYRT|nr:hypothetical protein MLD38_004229 [Melastoma candidum]